MNDDKRFVELTTRKRELEGDLRRVTDELSTIEARLLDDYLARGQTGATVDGYTLYLSRDLQVSTAGNGAAVAEALRAMGEGHMTTVNHQTLKSWLKESLIDPITGEWEADQRRVPEPLRGLIAVEERRSVRCRKA